MKKEFQATMYSMGVLHHYCGYSYFEEAVFLVIENPERLQSIQKEIYLPIAIKYHTNVAKCSAKISINSFG